MHYAIILASLAALPPLVGLIVRAPPKPVPVIEQPIPKPARIIAYSPRDIPVKTISIDSFNARWNIPPPLPTPKPVIDDILPKETPTRKRTIRHDTRGEKSICLRHRMRTVYYGRSWRCRK